MLWISAALGAPVVGSSTTVSEEVLVYADPLAPWDETDWLVKLQSSTSEERQAIEGERGSFSTSMWQVRAAIHCRVLEHRDRGGLVACSPTDVGLTVVTDDKWQRKSDRDEVDQVVQDLRATMLRGEVRLRVRDHGAARVLSNQPGTEDDVVAAELLRRVFDGFQLDLPEEGFYDGVQWVNDDEPLLKLRAGLESFGAEAVVHVGSRYQGQQIIQSHGVARKSTVVDHFEGQVPAGEAGKFQASYNPDPDTYIPYPKEIVRTRELTMDAVAVLDAERGFVTERVWTVTGKGIALERLGRLELLEEGARPVVGASGQVAPPGASRPHLAAWTPLEQAPDSMVSR